MVIDIDLLKKRKTGDHSDQEFIKVIDIERKNNNLDEISNE